jgi:hypothetical protein
LGQGQDSSLPSPEAEAVAAAGANERKMASTHPRSAVRAETLIMVVSSLCSD